MHFQIKYKTVIVLLFYFSFAVGRRYGGGGRSHSYPHSTGYSGVGRGHRTGSSSYSGASVSYSYQQNTASRGSHSYPPSTGYSGTGSGPSYSSKSGVSGYSGSSSGVSYKSKTEVHHHYHYTPPQQITYGSVAHPVYLGQPPVYVYTYKESGSRFDNLLTGLALYNLGRMSASHHSYNNYGNAQQQYRGVPGEVCKLGIRKGNGEYEETRVDCMLMSSFILEAGTPATNQRVSTSNSVVTSVTNVTQITNGNNTSVTKVTVKSEVKDALNVKGPSIAVVPGMTCYMIRMYRDMSTLRKNVECGLLQEYAQRSLYRNGVSCLKKEMFLINVVLLSSCFLFP